MDVFVLAIGFKARHQLASEDTELERWVGVVVDGVGEAELVVDAAVVHKHDTVTHLETTVGRGGAVRVDLCDRIAAHRDAEIVRVSGGEGDFAHGAGGERMQTREHQNHPALVGRGRHSRDHVGRAVHRRAIDMGEMIADADSSGAGGGG